MMDQEAESGVDFSFDLLRYVNGDEEEMPWNENVGMRYSQSETMLDPALITGIVLSPTSTTSEPTLSTTLATSTVVANPELKQFGSSIPGLTNEQHKPWGEER